MYGLTKATGIGKYAEEADSALSWFFENCQSETTGLMAWGEHMGWDFINEKPIVGEQSHTEGTHEFYRPWVLWSKVNDLAPGPFRKFARGLWDHQIGDQETGNFSRHALYYEHRPYLDSHYPRHGGFIINTWVNALAFGFENHEMDTAIQTLLRFYSSQRSPYSGGIPAETHYRSEGMMMWPSSNLSLAVDLFQGADKLEESTIAKEMKRQALKCDTVFLNIEHELEMDGQGFATTVNTNTLVPADVRSHSNRVFSRLWATGYGQATDAQMANLCMERYKQVANPGYKELIMATADRYLDSEPNIDFPIYPGTMGDVVWVLLNAYELSGEKNYIHRANYFAEKSIEMFLDDNSPLPKASTHHDHYEAITRGDTLMMALLRLWGAGDKVKGKMELVYSDR